MTNVPLNGGMSRKTVVGYGLPGFVTAIPVIPIAILLPSFYATELGLGLTLTGLALGLARLIDFFRQDGIREYHFDLLFPTGGSDTFGQKLNRSLITRWGHRIG